MSDGIFSLQPSTFSLPLILALDIGSSSTRALLYDGRGRALAAYGVQEQYALHATADGVSEDDPDVAVARAARCIDAVLTRAGPLAAHIAGVAVDTMAATFLALDAAGRPLTRLITYADTRNAAASAALRRDLDEAAVHDRTGCLLRTSYWPARLAWLRRNQPEVWRVAARFVTLGEYLELQLFGRCRVSYSAAAWSGLLDRRTLQWDAPLLAHLGVAAERLSPLVDVDEPLAGLSAPYAARWPALRGVPWFPAIGDGAAANIGSGCTDHRRIALTMGTTGAMRAVQAAVDTVPPGLWCYRVDRDHALIGGATSEGGNLYAWLRQTMRLGAPDEVEAALAAFPPDGHGLTVLPFLAGERSPGWAGDVQATIHGLTLATTPIAMVRAGLEAVAYRFAVIERRLCGRADCDHRLVASGSGLLRSPAWVQIFADVIGRPVVVSAEPEATSRGATLLALRSLGALAALEQAPAADGPLYAPDPDRHTIYQAAIARQQWLYDRLIGSREEGSRP
jgi:gluconokinase